MTKGFGSTDGEKIAAAGSFVTAIRAVVVLGLAALTAVAAHHWPIETFAVMGSFALGKMK